METQSIFSNILSKDTGMKLQETSMALYHTLGEGDGVLNI